MKTVLIVDCETTGLDPAKDKVIELAWARWSVEHSGKRSPMHLDSIGRYVLVDGYWQKYEEERHGDAQRFTAHWATCPKADEFRKR